MNALNIIFYIFISLIKFIFFCSLKGFSFVFYQTLEFFALNQSLLRYFEPFNVSYVSDIWMWAFYGILPKDNYINLFFDSNIPLNSYLFFYIIVFVLALFLVPLINFLKNCIKKQYKKKKINVIKSVVKVFFLGFLPILTLTINELTYLETNTFELSIISIIVFSLIAVAFPALIFKFLFGEDKKYWRRKLYFLIDPFKIQYKYYSIILLLRQFFIAIIINTFYYNSTLCNTLYLSLNIVYLVYYLIYKPFEQPYLQIQANLNMCFEIIILIFNYFIIYGYSIKELIITSITIQIICTVINLVIIYKDFGYRKIRNRKYIKNKPIELTDINTINIEVEKCSIPEWAKNEYLNNKESIEDIII